MNIYLLDFLDFRLTLLLTLKYPLLPVKVESGLIVLVGPQDERHI
jgi:hypothetical protein